MGLSYQPPERDPLLQCALNRDVFKTFLYASSRRIENSILYWDHNIFRFDSYFAVTFVVDVSTTLHEIICHVKHHIILFGCIYQCSAMENEKKNKLFKK